jgi:hypothetical protein
VHASVDESTPSDAHGVFYVVTAAMLLINPDDAEAALREVVAVKDRTRPFHWRLEGIEARERMTKTLGEIGAVAHVSIAYPTGRKRQEEARSAGLVEVVDASVAEGVTTVLIESRTAELDWRDRRSLAHHMTAGVVCEWHPKTHPLLWAADAVCGAVKEHLLQESNDALDEMRRAGVIGDLLYRKLP